MLSASLARAEPPRNARIGVLSSTNPETRAGFWNAFRDAMTKFGWVEGRNLVYVYSYASGDFSRFDALAVELVAEKPDLIFAGTQIAALAVRRATKETPIVFAVAEDPVGSGLVASLAHPGGNATGLSNQGIELVAKRMELLKELRPKLRHVAVMVAKSRLGDAQLQAAERAARTMGVEVLPLRVGSVDEIPGAIDWIARKSVDGALVHGPGLVDRRRVVALFGRMRIPVIYQLGEFVAEGGLMSYAADIGDNYHRAAAYANKILRGATPADLPVEQSQVFELAVNLKTAREQGIRIPQSVLLRATRVIE